MQLSQIWQRNEKKGEKVQMNYCTMYLFVVLLLRQGFTR
jgi:hypothetical protein